MAIKENIIKFDTIYDINCEELIDKLIDQNLKVNIVITDPPYNISKKNNFKTIGRAGIDFGEWDKNFDQTFWLKKIDKVLDKNGGIIIFNDYKNLAKICDTLIENGFEVKDLLRWIKPNPMPRNTNRRYVTDYELAIWATKKGSKWTFNKPSNLPYLKPEYICSSSLGRSRIHPTEKPKKLIEELIKTHTNEGDVIFDPFSGSGVISTTAFELNRSFIACEISKKYYEDSIKRLKKLYIKPTFNHLGNKYRMLGDLLREFPKKNIDNFIDVFAGSGLVSLNYKTPTKFYINDKDKWLSKILEHLINTNVGVIIKEIERIIKKFKLPVFSRPYKKEYENLKKEFNKTKKISQLLVLVLYGFNQQIRFNNKNEFNIPSGKFWWNEYHKQKLIEYSNACKNKKIKIFSHDFCDLFKEISDSIDPSNSLFYLDPPYLISDATYNSGWDDNMEKKLIDFLEKLTSMKYKWILSNSIESKGKTNQYLSNFINKNPNVKVEYVEKIKYSNSNYQRKNKAFKDVEILIKGNF